jgi:hypothetical protein
LAYILSLLIKFKVYKNKKQLNNIMRLNELTYSQKLHKKANQEQNNISSEFPDQLALSHYLRQHCKTSLNLFLSNGHVLYCGIRAHGFNPSFEVMPLYFIGESPKSRVPKDSPTKLQTLIDGMLLAQNFKAVRSNSIFCSPSPSTVVQYGKRHMIFPIDPFDFTYSDILNDLYEDFHDSDILQARRSVENLGSEKASRRFVQEWQFEQDNYEAALNSGNEVYVHGKFVAVNASDDTQGQWLYHFLKDQK